MIGYHKFLIQCSSYKFIHSFGDKTGQGQQKKILKKIDAKIDQILFYFIFKLKKNKLLIFKHVPNHICQL